jgi:hypothetical protein
MAPATCYEQLLSMLLESNLYVGEPAELHACCAATAAAARRVLAAA